jgi:hypothetical protein
MLGNRFLSVDSKLRPTNGVQPNMQQRRMSCMGFIGGRIIFLESHGSPDEFQKPRDNCRRRVNACNPA